MIRIFNSSDINRREYREVQITGKKKLKEVEAYDRTVENDFGDRGGYVKSTIYKYTIKDAKPTLQDVEDADLINTDC